MKFSTKWKKSTKSRKQRNYKRNAPLHIKQKFVRSHLSKELKKKYNKRSAGIRKGDKVKVVMGQFKGKTGKVDRVDLKKNKVHITGIERVKKDGAKVNFPIHTSNLIITELDMDDKMRQKALERK